MITSRPVSASIPVCKVIDRVDYFSATPNVGNPSLLENWNCKIELLKLDYEKFDLCVRPDDFEVKLDRVTAAVTHGTLPDRINIRYQSFSGNRVLLLLVKYPLVVTDTDKPYLQISAATAPFYAGDPMDSTDISVVVKDLVAGGFEWFSFSCDINNTFDSVTITNSNATLLMPSVFSGDFFEVSI